MIGQVISFVTLSKVPRFSYLNRRALSIGYLALTLRLLHTV